MKPFAESCEQNKDPILRILQNEFSNIQSILEIGSGTGQHAVFFAEQLPHLTWQTSECEENIAGIKLWIDDAALDNILRPLPLNVLKDSWPQKSYEGCFSANTSHIMSWKAVTAMFEGISSCLQTEGVFCLYGPFNYDGKYTSESNRSFDQYLKARDPESGIRDLKDLEKLASTNRLTLKMDYEMPANNRILVWEKSK